MCPFLSSGTAVPKPAFDWSHPPPSCSFLLPTLCLGNASPSAFPTRSHHETPSVLGEGRGEGWKGGGGIEVWGSAASLVDWGAQGSRRLMAWRIAGPWGPCLTCGPESGTESGCWEKWAKDGQVHSESWPRERGLRVGSSQGVSTLRRGRHLSVQGAQILGLRMLSPQPPSDKDEAPPRSGWSRDGPAIWGAMLSATEQEGGQ